jgi:tape measure domain-containing protein
MGVSIGSIFGTLDLTDRATGKFNNFIGQLDKASGKIAGMGTILSGFSAGMAAVGLGALKAAGEFQQTGIAFTTMLGSAERAKAFLDEMQDFAAATPFEFPDLVDASRRLLALGFTAQQVKPMLTTVGDAVAGLGLGAQGIDRITLALGQMQSKGKVSAQEMNQLAESGIGAWQMVADKIGTTIPEAMKKAEAGTISAAVAIPAILEGMTKKFGGMMDQQSKTMLGQISTLKDEFGFIVRDFGTALMPVAESIITALKAVLPAVKSVAQSFAELSPGMRTAIVAMAALAASIGPLLLALAATIKAVAAVSSALTVAKAAMFAFGNTVPVLTARIWLMNAATTVAGTLLGKLALIGAAAFIGWQIGKVIDDTFQLSKKIGELIVGVQTLRNLEKGTGSVGALKLGIDPTQFNMMDKWQSAIKKTNEANAKLRESSTQVSVGVKQVTGATDEQIRAMVRAAKDAKTLKDAKEILGREAVSLAEAQRAVSIETAMTSTKLSEEARVAKEAAERMAALKHEWAAFGKAREILFSAGAGVGQKKLDPFFGIEPEGLQRLSDASLEAVEAAERMRRAREILHDVGQLPGQNALDPFKGIDMPGLEKSISPDSMKRIGAPAGKSLGDGLRDSFKQALVDLPGVVMGALQGGGDLGKSIGGLFGGSLGSALGESVAKGIGGTLGKTLGAALPGIGSILGSLAGGLVDKIFGGGEGAKVNDMRDQFVAAQGGLAALGAKAKEVGLDLTALLKADKVSEFEAAVRSLTGAWDEQRQRQEDAKNATTALNDAIKDYGFEVSELGPVWQQQDLDGKTSKLLRDVQLLNAAQVDHNAMIERMGPAFQDVVTQARATGSSIPEALRPMIEEMAKAGKLVDESGNAFGSAEEAGITFAQTMSESMQSVADDVKRLVDALLGIGNVRIPPITIPVQHESSPGDGMGIPRAPSAPIPMQHGAVVTRPTLGLVGERGPEVVSSIHEFKKMVREFSSMSGGGGEARVQVMLGERVLVDALAELVRDNKHGARTRIRGGA